MRRRAHLAALVLAIILMPGAAALQTVYEAQRGGVAGELQAHSREGADFVPVPLWHDGRIVHCVQFMVHGAGTGGQARAPMPVYLPTRDGTLAGVPKDQMPLLSHHQQRSDGSWDPAYNDLAELYLVHVPSGYPANGHSSAHQMTAYARTPTGIHINMPLVPKGSLILDPDAERQRAPIIPWKAWHNGTVVDTLVMETDDADFAAWIDAKTRLEPYRGGEAYGARVVELWDDDADRLLTDALMFLNSYPSDAAVPSGPDPDRQRNIVDNVASEAGYRPFKHLVWVTKVPVGHTDGSARAWADPTPARGYATQATDHIINCPHLGPVRGADADVARTAPSAGVPDAGKSTVMGSTPEGAGLDVQLVASGPSGKQELARGRTDALGHYAFEVNGDRLDGTLWINATRDDDVIASWPVVDEPEQDSPLGLWVALAALAGAALLRRR